VSPDLLFVVGLVLGILIGAGAAGIFVWRTSMSAVEEWVADNYNSDLRWTAERGLEAVPKSMGPRVIYHVTNDPAVRVP
jgi:hypothetical protein